MTSNTRRQFITTRRRIPRPDGVLGWLLTGVAGVVAVGAAGVLFIYFVLFSHSAPAPLALASPSAVGASPALTATEIPGSWTVAAHSVAGYRVREQLAEFGMQVPNVAGFVSVDSTATMEFDLFLKHG